jgi:hypothetical protein
MSFLTLLGLLLPLTFAHSQGLRDNDPETFRVVRDTSFLPLFQAMKEGNVAVIKQYLNGKSYDEYRTLFDRNKTYGEFLRNYYSGASFVLNDITKEADGNYIANVSIDWTDGRNARIELEVSPPSSRSGKQGGKWMIGKPAEGRKAK